MDTIRNALERKFGPLPAWAWLGIVGVVIYLYRRRKSSGVTSVTNQNVAPGPNTDQPPVTLDPGQSVYNPNTGTLLTSPGDGSASNGSGVGDNGGGNSMPIASPNGTNPAPIVNVFIPRQGHRVVKPKHHAKHGPPRTSTHGRDKDGGHHQVRKPGHPRAALKPLPPKPSNMQLRGRPVPSAKPAGRVRSVPKPAAPIRSHPPTDGGHRMVGEPVHSGTRRHHRRERK